MKAALYDHLPFENLYWNQMETLLPVEMEELQRIRLRKMAERGAVPRHEILRIYGSACYTRQDCEVAADGEARCLYAAGLRSNHLVQVLGEIAFASDGISKVGAGILPENTDFRVNFERWKPECLVIAAGAVPDFVENVRKRGIQPGELSLKFACLDVETLSEEPRKLLESCLGIQVYTRFGLSGALGPAIAGECCHRCGLHVQEDRFLVECWEPGTCEAVPDGEPGELVVTELARESEPKKNYRTGEIVRFDRSPCACGRTAVRIHPVTRG